MCSPEGCCRACCCGKTIVKVFFWISNFIYVVFGVALITMGAIMLQDLNHYSELFDGTYYAAPIIAVSLGAAVCLVAFYGCIAAVADSRGLLFGYSVIVFVILILQTSLGGYCISTSVQGSFTTQMQSFFNQEYSETDHESPTFDYWHSRFGCCGVLGPYDFNTIFEDGEVPRSCCYYLNSDEPVCSVQANGLKSNGCTWSLSRYVENSFVDIGITCLSGIWTAVLTLICGLCLASRLKISHIGSNTHPESTSPGSGFK